MNHCFKQLLFGTFDCRVHCHSEKFSIASLATNLLKVTGRTRHLTVDPWQNCCVEHNVYLQLACMNFARKSCSNENLVSFQLYLCCGIFFTILPQVIFYTVLILHRFILGAFSSNLISYNFVWGPFSAARIRTVSSWYQTFVWNTPRPVF